MGDMKKYIKWQYVKMIMETVQFLILVLGVCFSVYQINEMANNRLGRKNELAIFYFDRLNSGSNRKINIAINNKKSILKDIKPDQIDDFLNDLHGVGNGLERGLLDGDIVCSDFSDIAIKAYENNEIKNYLLSVRNEDNTFFKSFDSLYYYLINYCS